MQFPIRKHTMLSGFYRWVAELEDQNPDRGANMKIRYGIIADATLLAELGARTFFDTFAKDNTRDDMETHLNRTFSPGIQLQELSEPNTLFLIAEVDGLTAGYAQLILNSKDEAIKGSRPLEIRRIYALQDFLGKGVGKELMQAAIR